jgi:hypothetical protein
VLRYVPSLIEMCREAVYCGFCIVGVTRL